LRSAEISSVFIYVGYKLIQPESLICYQFIGYQKLGLSIALKSTMVRQFLRLLLSNHQVNQKTLNYTVEANHKTQQ